MRIRAAISALVMLLAGQAFAGPRDNVAVIIGNRNYQPGVPAVEFAHNDADAMARFVTDGLGIPKENLILLKDAGKAQMEAVFGSADSHEGKLWSLVRPGESEVVVYYSGHGIPDPRDKRGYLLPTDADPNTPRINGYSLDRLLANLGKVEAKSVTVYLDACFSGISAKGALVQNVSAFSTGIERPKPKPNVNVITAASADQYAGWDEQARHGLFTEHLLRALYGEAEGVKGVSKVTLADLKRVLDRDMTYAARRGAMRVQTADVLGSEGVVLASWPSGRVPVRPDSGGVRTVAVAPVPPSPVLTPAQPTVAPPSVTQPSSSRLPGSVFRDCADCPEMVVVPAGSFMMGSEEGDTNEKPVHRVTIGRSFAVGKYAVTQAEWESVMGSNPSKFRGSRNPVEQVSWNDAQDFINRLNAKVRSVVQVSTGGNGPYRLLTEAEWEYAARAGTTTTYPWGGSIGSGNANCKGCGSQWDNKSTAPVGSFRPNAFGLYDMHGNVWQRVQDCYVVSYADAPSDGSAAPERNSCNRVGRGGSWAFSPWYLPSFVRGIFSPDDRLDDLGFRVARTLP